MISFLYRTKFYLSASQYCIYNIQKGARVSLNLMCFCGGQTKPFYCDYMDNIDFRTLREKKIFFFFWYSVSHIIPLCSNYIRYLPISTDSGLIQCDASSINKITISIIHLYCVQTQSIVILNNIFHWDIFN